jgi:hypothetical protein
MKAEQDRRYHVSHYYVLDRHKKPVPCTDMKAWHHWMQSANRVLRRSGNNKTYVATVFLGIDKAHAKRQGSYVDPPLLFEVRMFRSNSTHMVESYATWGGAELAHDRMVRELIPTNDYA